MTDKEAMKLALEALEIEQAIYRGDREDGTPEHILEAITAIKEALAQPEQDTVQRLSALVRAQQITIDKLEAQQEPVAWEQFYPEMGSPKLAYLSPTESPDNACYIPPQRTEQEPEFIQHVVEHPTDWSEWVCPDPKGYLMKCCDCGLVHEAEFGVVRYKSETEREDCDRVDDPNLQAVFRMRRSEQWSPEDTAHRAGGLPMAQPEQEPVANYCRECLTYNGHHEGCSHYTSPLQRKPLTDEEIEDIWADCPVDWDDTINVLTLARAIEAAHGIKENT